MPGTVFQLHYTWRPGVGRRFHQTDCRYWVLFSVTKRRCMKPQIKLDIGMTVRMFVHALGDLDSISGRIISKTQKWYLMPPCLTLSITRYGSRVKWSNPGKGVIPCPTPWCSSYRKGSLRVTLDYGRQLYLVRLIGLVGRVFANGPGHLGSIQGHVIPKTLKWYLIPLPCLTHSNIRYE